MTGVAPHRLHPVAAVAMALALTAGCDSARRSPGPPEPGAATGPIVLITIDTLRADRLGSYGSQRHLTPTLDALARQATRFACAIAQVPLTRPSHATILTGRHPAGHGVRTNDGFRLDPSVPTLAEALRRRGYATGAFIGGYPLKASSGLARGFDTYDDRFLNTPGVVERRADEVVRAAGDWIAGRASKPFFAWVHLFDPHSPYAPPPAYAAAHRDAPYDGEIAYTDAAIGRLFDRLRDLGLFDAAAIVVVADHGEGLGEHGERTHGTFVYDSTIHVPLLVKLPRARAAHVVDAPVETADLAPTIAGLAGADLRQTDGRSLLPLLHGAPGDPERPAYAESYYLNVLLGWSPLRAVRTGRWKYIEAPHPELYDIRADPGELRNLAATRRPLVAGFERTLGPAAGPGVPDAANPDAAERLRSLGYVSGGMTATPDRLGIDPKDRIVEWSEIEHGIDLMATDPAASARALDRAIRRDPANGLAIKYLADLSFTAGRLDDARRGYTRALDAGFTHPDIYVNLAAIAEREGRPSDAAAALAEAVRRSPSDADAWNRLGLLEARRNRLPAAADAFAKAVAAAPDRAEAYYNAGVIARRMGRDADARTELRHAIELNPRYPEARYELGTLELASGNDRAALTQYQAALDSRPDYPEALFGAARAALDLGLRDDARRDYERFVRVAPRAYARQIAAAQQRLRQLSARN